MAAAFVPTLAGAVLWRLLLDAGRANGYRFLWGIAFAVAFYAAKRFWECGDRRAQVCFGLLGGAFALAIAFGYRLEITGATGWNGIALCLGAALCMFPAAGQMFYWLCGLLSRGGRPVALGRKKCFCIAAALLIAGWSPVMMAYYPGIFSYDMPSQIYQVTAHAYNTHHPLAHTLLLGAFYTLGGALGNHTLGVFLYCLAQMLLVACAMAYALSYLAELKCPRWLVWALTAVFALGPNHALLVLVCTKDIPFEAGMVVFAVQVHRLYRDRALLRRVGFCASLVFTVVWICLMRNNASIAVALFLIVAVIAMPRGGRARLAALIVAALVAGVGVNEGLRAVTNAYRGSVNEMLSVPAQQLSRVHHLYGYDVDVSYEIEEYVPNAWRYRPERSDFVKLHLATKRPEKLLGFIKLWGKTFFAYPTEYLDAFLYVTKGYWFPDDLSFASIYGEGLATREGVLDTSTPEGIDVKHVSLFKGLEAVYEQLFSANEYQRSFLLSALIHPATYVWLLGFALAWAVYARKRAALMAGCALAVYLFTLFLGPCALVRYCYYLMIAVPWLLGVLATETA